MIHQVHHHRVLQSGKQPGVNGGVLKEQLAESRLIFLQINWNAAGHAGGQEGKQSERHMQQAKPISTMVEVAILVQPNAPPFSMTRSKSASSGRAAGHGKKRMALQPTNAQGDAIELRIGFVNLVFGVANVMWI